MKFGDLVRFVSDAEVVDNLHNLSSQLRTASSTITVRDKDDYLGFTLANLTTYAAGQLGRLASLYQAGIEVHAWIARNLFEVCLICDFLLLDPLRAKEFVAQKASDELQINEGFISLSGDPVDSALQPVLERNIHIRNVLAKHGLPDPRHWQVSTLAKQTRNETEYEAFFKLYSKYVHPSSWLVLAAPNEVDTPVLRNVFLIQAQYYGARILKIAQDISMVPTDSSSTDVDA